MVAFSVKVAQMGKNNNDGEMQLTNTFLFSRAKCHAHVSYWYVRFAVFNNESFHKWFLLLIVHLTHAKTYVKAHEWSFLEDKWSIRLVMQALVYLCSMCPFRKNPVNLREKNRPERAHTLTHTHLQHVMGKCWWNWKPWNIKTVFILSSSTSVVERVLRSEKKKKWKKSKQALKPFQVYPPPKSFFTHARTRPHTHTGFGRGLIIFFEVCKCIYVSTYYAFKYLNMWSNLKTLFKPVKFILFI